MRQQDNKIAEGKKNYNMKQPTILGQKMKPTTSASDFMIIIWEKKN